MITIGLPLSTLCHTESCFKLDWEKHLRGDVPLTFYIFHDHAEVTSCFKWAKHGDDKRVLCKSKDVSFHKSLLDLVPQNQVLTIYLLHGKPLAGLLVADQIHGAVNEKKITKGYEPNNAMCSQHNNFFCVENRGNEPELGKEKFAVVGE